MRPRNFGLRVNQPGATEGFTLYSPLWRPKTFLLNMSGEVVHEWDLPGNPGGYARLLPSGNLFYSSNVESDDKPPFEGGAKGGLIREVDWDGNVLIEHFDGWQHHDLRRLDNGNILYCSWEIMPEEHAKRVRGGIPGSELPEGIVNDVLREVTPEGDLVWEWHAYEMDIEDYPLHPLCPRRVWAWMNTCAPLTNGDVLISLRQINTLAIIDRQTNKLRWVRRDDSWGHQHDSQMLDNGNIMLFANGMNTAVPHPHSYITEFNPDTNETVWEYRDDPATFFYSHHISGAERLWTGNTLICEGSFGRLFEVTPAGEIVWEFVNPYFDPMFMGDTVNWVFRAFRYSADSPEIAGRVS